MNESEIERAQKLSTDNGLTQGLKQIVLTQ